MLKNEYEKRFEDLLNDTTEEIHQKTQYADAYF